MPYGRFVLTLAILTPLVLLIGIIEFGVESEKDIDAISGILLSLGIPNDAFRVYESLWDAPMQSTTVHSAFSPLVGGIEINGSTNTTLEDACTINFVTTSSSYGPGIVTASHCTSLSGGIDPSSSVYFYIDQPSQGSTAGEEVLDPPHTTSLSGCPSGKKCRYSDSALFYAYSDSAVDHGKLANPYLPGLTNLIYIDPNKPRLDIIGSANNLPKGAQIHWIGRSSGGGDGVISDTCVKSARLNNITYLCQDLAITNPIISTGDSGGPVFQFYGGDLNLKQVKMAGLISARKQTVDQEMVISRYIYVSSELTASAY
jgi:hypothetical protein